MTGALPVLSETDLAYLQDQLALADLYARPRTDETLELLVLRREHIKVRMRQEPNHRRPHFHIEYKQEFSASYAIDTLQRLAGYMPARYERQILEWAESQRAHLEATWGELQHGDDVRELVLGGTGEPSEKKG